MSEIRNAFTRRLLIDGGIGKGMRVLDVGCGTGDLGMMVAELVGDTGEVIGVDISGDALTTAKKTVQDKRLLSVKFLQADIAKLPDMLGTFDAIVGRRVLMYLANPAQGIENLIPHLTPDGKMIFQESDDMAASFCADSLPLHTHVQAWIWDTVKREGGDIHIGRQLYTLMKSAGLSVVQIRAEAVLHTPETGSDLGWVAKMMALRIIRQGVATAEEMDVDTLEERLQAELRTSGVAFVRDMAFGICAEKQQI